jgi:hypothetical protein
VYQPKTLASAHRAKLIKNSFGFGKKDKNTVYFSTLSVMMIE